MTTQEIINEIVLNEKELEVINILLAYVKESIEVARCDLSECKATIRAIDRINKGDNWRCQSRREAIANLCEDVVNEN